MWSSIFPAFSYEGIVNALPNQTMSVLSLKAWIVGAVFGIGL